MSDPAPLPRWATAVGPLLVLLLYGPTLLGSYLSDDYLVNTILTHDDAPRVVWPEALADFSRSWAGLEGSAMYRPMVTLSLAATFAVAGAAPFAFHLLNVVLHAVAAYACARACASCAPGRPGIAAVVGGSLLALHPAIAEATCWISARTTGLQLMFSCIAMAGYASFLASGRKRGLGFAFGGFVGALLSKENAVIVPLSWLALELLVRGWKRPHLKVHITAFALLATYFLWRRIILGAFVGGDDAGLHAIQSDAYLTTLIDKLRLLVHPVGSSLPEPFGTVSGWVTTGAVACLLLLGSFTRRSWWSLGVLAAWLVVHLAPTFRMPVDNHTLLGSRMVVGATSALAVAAGIAAGRSPLRRFTTVLAGLLLLGLAPLGTGRMTAFLRAYSDMDSLRTSLEESAAKATPERPLGVVTVNRDVDGVTFLNCNAIFPLLERPFVAVDRPMVSFGFVFQPVPDSEDLLFDVGPWRAMREMGADIFEWHRAPTGPATVIRDHKSQTPPQALPALTAKGNQFLAPHAIDPRGVEEVTIETPQGTTGGTLRWLFFAGGKPMPFEGVPAFAGAAHEVRFAGGRERAGKTVFRVDLSHHLTFLALYKTEGLAGFTVTLDGGKAASAVRMHARVGDLPLPTRLAGRTVDLDATQGGLVAPQRPTDSSELWLFLVGPDTTHRFPVTPGDITLSDHAKTLLRVVLRCYRQKRYYFYFEASGPRTYRSPVDWLVFRDDR